MRAEKNLMGVNVSEQGEPNRVSQKRYKKGGKRKENRGSKKKKGKGGVAGGKKGAPAVHIRRPMGRTE